MARCPSDNANRNIEVQIGQNMKTGKPIMGRKCLVCGTQWKGELYTPLQMEKFYES